MKRVLRPVVWLGLLVGVAGGWSAVADPAKKDEPAKDAAGAGAALRYARSYADAIAEARDRGCVLFLTFHGDGWKHCVTMHRSVLENAEFAEWADEHVVVAAAHGRGSHGTVDVARPAKGDPKKQCSLYPGITCEQHDAIWKDAQGKADEKDADKAKKPSSKKKDAPPPLPTFKVAGIPASYVILPDGTSAEHKAHGEPGACRSFLEEQQKKADEHPIPLSKWGDVKAAWAEAEKAFKAGRWKATLEAIAKAEAVVGGALPASYVERVKTKAEALDAKLAAKVADAQKLKDPAAAARALAAAKAEFGVAIASAPLPSLAALDAALEALPK